MANKYDIGKIVRLSVEFKDAVGTFVDPGQVFLKIRDSFGVVIIKQFGVDGDLIKDAVGRYHLDQEATKEGIWFYRFEGKVSNKSATETAFQVLDSQFYQTGGGAIT